jgi:hypothetical protein
MEPVKQQLVLYSVVIVLAYVLGRWFSKYYRPFFHVISAAAFLIVVIDSFNGISIRVMIHDSIGFSKMLGKELVHLASYGGTLIFLFVFIPTLWHGLRKGKISGWRTRSESLPFYSR